MSDGQDWSLLSEACVCQNEALMRMLSSAGLTDLERILESIHHKTYQSAPDDPRVPQRGLYGYPMGLSVSAEDEAINRNLQSLAGRCAFTTEARQELIHNLMRKYSELDTTSLTENQISSLAVVRRSLLLLSLYNALWSTERSQAASEPLPWHRVVDLLTWSTEADVTLDPDLVVEDCQNLIIDVEKRVYAATVCRRASEAFHDENSHQQIVGHILILFMFGYWDHAILLIERCFTYADQAYRDFLNLLSYHFPRVKYAWEDIGNPSHPMRDEGAFQKFRLDVRKIFIDETKLRMNENHLLRPIVTLLGCIPQLLRVDDDADFEERYGDVSQASSVVAEEELAIYDNKPAATGFADDVDELISRIFEVYREINNRKSQPEDSPPSPPSLNNSFTISWFCCTLFWNRYYFISMLRESSIAMKLTADDRQMDSEDSALQQADNNVIGYIYQCWAREKKINMRSLPLSDIAFSLMIGNDLDQLLHFLDINAWQYLPTTATLIATLSFFNFDFSAAQLIRILMKAIPQIARMLKGLSKKAPEEIWSLESQKQMDALLGPFATFHLLLMRVDSNSIMWDNPDWWVEIGEANFELARDSMETTLIYSGMKFAIQTLLFAYPQVTSQVRACWLDYLLKDSEAGVKLFACLEYQSLIGEISDKWVVENEGKLEADMTPIPDLFYTARGRVKQLNQSRGILSSHSTAIQILTHSPDLIELAMNTSQYPQVANPAILGLAIFALLTVADNSACPVENRVEIIKKAYYNTRVAARHAIKIDEHPIWALLARLSSEISLMQRDVAQILEFYPELLSEHDDIDLRLLKVRSARRMIFNAIDS